MLPTQTGAMEHWNAGIEYVPAILNNDVSVGFKDRDNCFQKREQIHYGSVNDRIGIENLVDAFQSHCMWMLNTGDRQRHLFLVLFAHFLVASLLSL